MTISKNLFLTLVLFLFSFLIHLVGLNFVGRTWDEQFKIDNGFIALKNISYLNFAPSSWTEGVEHPMIAKYLYSLAALPNYHQIDSNTIPKNLEQNFLNGDFILTDYGGGNRFLVDYDYTFPRMLSAVFNSLAIVGIYLLSRKWLGTTSSFLGAISVMFIPRFVAMGQLVTFESLSAFLVLLLLLVFFNFRNNLRYYLLLGIISGLLFWTRYNNAYVFLLLAGLVVIGKKFTPRWILIPLVAVIFGIVTWPYLWTNPLQNFLNSFYYHPDQWLHIGVKPSLYFATYFIYTTPILFLVLSVLGLRKAPREILFWLVSYAVFCLAFTLEKGGTRYVFFIYPIMGVLLAFAFDQILQFKKIARVVIIGLFLFFTFTMVKAYPYYLEYYNEIIGGAKGAVKHNLEFSWWGDGQREAGNWLQENAPAGSTISLLVTPKYVFKSPGENFTILPDNKDFLTADYVVVSRTNLPEMKKLSGDKFYPVHEVTSDNEALIYIFKKAAKDTVESKN